MSVFWKTFLFMALCSVSSYAWDMTDFEKSVKLRAENEPGTAYDYFLEKIEGGATVEEQAVYLYGMGIAHEKQGNIEEAVNDYLSAEALGYYKATKELKRLRQ